MKSPFNLQSHKIADRCYFYSKIVIYCLVFLLPIFFLPFTTDPLDFNKQMLLIFLVSIAFLLWLVKILNSKKANFHFNFFGIPVLFFFLFYGLSVIFSQWSYGSFWGWPLNVSQGFLALFYFVIFYLLVTNIFRDKEDIFWLLFFFVVSGTLGVLFSFFQIFGKFLLPWGFAKFASFNTIGSLQSLSIFVASLLPLVVSLIFVAKKKFISRILAIFGFVLLIYLLLINFSTAWVILISGLSIILIFSILNLNKKTGIHLVWISAFLLIFSLLFLVFEISPINIQLEILPSYKTEIDIAKNTLSKDLFFGTGPATFIFNYSKFKPVEINQTIFWNIRFTNGSSEILDKLITSGILGFFSLISIFILVFQSGFKYLKKEQKDWVIPLGILSSFFASVFSQFLYPANLTYLFFFWLLLGVSAVLFPKIKSWESKSPSLITVAPSVLAAFLLLGLCFLSFKYYLAEVHYTRGIKAWRQGQPEQAIHYIKEAIDLNSSLDTYWRDLAQLYLVKLNLILPEGDLSSEEIRDLVNGMLDFSKRATEISPENVTNWNIRASLYQNLIGLVGGAEDWSLRGFQEAADLDPQNPYIFTEMGKIYLNKADISTQLGNKEQETLNLAQAQEKFQKAIELKSDYAPAHFQIAMIYAREGKIEEAIEKLEIAKSVAPFDTGLAFQLGLLYYNSNRLDLARAELERAVAIDENYSNARYFLGLIYDQQGVKDKAIEQFERIEELNPENREVKMILDNLRKGLPALEGIQPSQPPVEEEPLERKP